MSANNQTLIKEYKGRYYVFGNIQAESWCDENEEHVNELSLTEAIGVFDLFEEAYKFALEKDTEDDFGGTEYGVQVNNLCKDGEDVVIVDEAVDK